MVYIADFLASSHTSHDTYSMQQDLSRLHKVQRRKIQLSSEVTSMLISTSNVETAEHEIGFVSLINYCRDRKIVNNV